MRFRCAVFIIAVLALLPLLGCSKKVDPQMSIAKIEKDNKDIYDHLRTMMEAEEERDAIHRWERMTPEEKWQEEQYLAELYRNSR